MDDKRALSATAADQIGRVCSHLLWGVDDARVEAELEHAQDSGEDGEDEHACQSLWAVVSAGAQEWSAHQEGGLVAKRRVRSVKKCTNTRSGCSAACASDGLD